MKLIKKILVLLSLLAILVLGINYVFYEPTEINAVISSKIYKDGVVNSAFEDENFYKCVVDAYNNQNKTSVAYTYNISDEELQTITHLNCNIKNITSVKGLEKMITLKSLHLFSNQLTELDVSNNTALTSLDVSSNKLTELDVSNNTALTILSVSSNKLTELDVSNNTSLTHLDAELNRLTELDVSNNVSLTSLAVSSNKLTELDVSNNAKLTFLDVHNNDLDELDVSNNTSLTHLYVSSNQLTELDVSNNTSLTYLAVSSNQLTELDVSNNTALTFLDAEFNRLTELDVSNNTALTFLDVSNNDLDELDVSNNTSLIDLYINDNPFGENLYVYKGTNNLKIENKIKLPSSLNWDEPVWSSSDESLAVVSTDGSVKTLKNGSVNIIGCVSGKYTIDNKVNIVEITSDKYQINEEKNYIYIGADNEVEKIKENVNISHEGIILDVDLDSNKMQVKYNDDILKEFDILRISSEVYDLSKEYIYIGTDSFNNRKINVVNCNIEISNSRLLIKYGDVLLDEYILVEVSFNGLELLDNEYLYKIEVGTSVNDILDMIDTNGSITVTNNKGTIIDGDSFISTGTKISIKLNSKIVEYTVIISGDVDGDGELKLQDIMKIANYLYKNKSILSGIYLVAADYDMSGDVKLSDIMKIANDLYVGKGDN